MLRKEQRGQRLGERGTKYFGLTSDYTDLNILERYYVKCFLRRN